MDEARIGCGGARIGCGVAVFVVLDVFFFVEEAFVGAFRLVMTTATATSNWWVVGVERNFGRFYTLFVMNFRENDFWSQPSKNRCTEHADSLSVGLETINPILATSTNAVTAPDHITVSPSQEY